MYSSAQYSSSPWQTLPKSPSPLKATVSATRPRSSFSSQHDSPSHRHARRNIQSTKETETPQSCASSLDRSFFSSPLSDVDGRGGGIGNLADELADIWDEEGNEEEELQSCADELDTLEESPRNARTSSWSQKIQARKFNSGSPLSKKTSVRDLSSSLQHSDSQEKLMRSKQDQSRLSISARYDNQAIYQDNWMTTPLSNLEACVAELEGLANSSIISSHGSSDVYKLTALLREIATQSHLETLISTYINTHTTLTTSCLRQTRLLASLSSILSSPFSNIELDTFDLGGLLSSTLLTEHTAALAPTRKPESTQASRQHLAALTNTTTAVINTLSNLTDTLHIEQELSATFARKLKGVRDLVSEMKREEEENEAARRWIEDGEWQERLRERECERRCMDEVRGFEEVCGGWRERLIAGAG